MLQKKYTVENQAREEHDSVKPRFGFRGIVQAPCSVCTGTAQQIPLCFLLRGMLIELKILVVPMKRTASLYETHHIESGENCSEKGMRDVDVRVMLQQVRRSFGRNINTDVILKW